MKTNEHSYSENVIAKISSRSDSPILSEMLSGLKNYSIIHIKKSKSTHKLNSDAAFFILKHIQSNDLVTFSMFFTKTSFGIEPVFQLSFYLDNSRAISNTIKTPVDELEKELNSWAKEQTIWNVSYKYREFDGPYFEVDSKNNTHTKINRRGYENQIYATLVPLQSSKEDSTIEESHIVIKNFIWKGEDHLDVDIYHVWE